MARLAVWALSLIHISFMKLEIIFFSVEIGEKNRTPDREMRSNVRPFSKEKPSGESRLFGCSLL